MSEKESRRRKIIKYVMIEAWRLFKKGLNIHYSWSSCLILSWSKIRGKSRLYFGKVQGTTFTNEDGINRQSLLRRLAAYPQNMVSLFFQRDYDNSFDSNAIQVKAKVSGIKSCHTIGYLKRDHAFFVAPLIDEGYDCIVVFQNITGGQYGLYYGCNFTYSYFAKKRKSNP